VATGLRQRYRFKAQSETLVEVFLRSLKSGVILNEEREFFTYRSAVGEPAFLLICTIVLGGIQVQASGQYRAFLGRFVEGLVEEFGLVTVERA
jgi:hypothetical protein